MKKIILDNWVDLLIIAGILLGLVYAMLIFCKVADSQSPKQIYPLEVKFEYCVDGNVVLGLADGYLYKLVDNKTVTCNPHASGVIKK